MNIILFADNEILSKIPLTDYRAIHLKRILKLNIGDSFKAGILDGKIGIATIKEFTSHLTVSFIPKSSSPSLYPITLICGLTRPPVAKRILRDAVSAGILNIYFVTVDNCEKSYAKSKLWTTDEYKQAMLDGAQQGVTTLLPKIELFHSLGDLLRKKEFIGDKVILDNAQLSISLSKYLLNNSSHKETVLAIGAERGWTNKEKKLLMNNRFNPCTLGDRILRTETAVTAAINITIGIKTL